MSVEKLKDFLGDAYDFDNQEFNKEKAKQQVLDKKDKINVVLFGATGVGKSSLINAIFGQDIVKSGSGIPITQHLEKIEIKEKGLTLWDTKGIEAKNYEETKSQLIKEISDAFSDAFRTEDDSKFPHVAWLCIKESSSRIEDREIDLLGIAREFKIPTVVVFTDTQWENGDDFVDFAKNEFGQKGFNSIINNRYARVNSIDYTIQKYDFPKSGLEELISLTKNALNDSKNTTQAQKKSHTDAFTKAQEVNKKEKFEAMKAGARKKVHLASAAAAAVGASPIPGSDAPLIAAVQSTLIYSLNSEFLVSEENANATSIITGILGVTGLAQVGKAIVSNALKFIPGAGTIVGGAISAAAAAALTQAMGHAYIQVLISFFDEEQGKTILPEETSRVLNAFSSYFKIPKK